MRNLKQPQALTVGACSAVIKRFGEQGIYPSVTPIVIIDIKYINKAY
jgi:hypothetical protein